MLAGGYRRSPRWISRQLRTRPCLPRDIVNRRRYGPDGPLFAEAILVNPQELRLSKRRVRQSESATVVAGDWDAGEPRSPRDTPTFRALERRFFAGATWEETGIIDEVWAWTEKHPGHNGCFTRQDIVNRYAQMDRLFEQARSEGRLRWQHELATPNFREYGGPLISITRDGRMVTSRESGNHRLAMALLLGLNAMPAQVGLVHRSVIHGWRDRCLSA